MSNYTEKEEDGSGGCRGDAVATNKLICVKITEVSGISQGEISLWFFFILWRGFTVMEERPNRKGEREGKKSQKKKNAAESQNSRLPLFDCVQPAPLASPQLQTGWQGDATTCRCHRLISICSSVMPRPNNNPFRTAGLFLCLNAAPESLTPSQAAFLLFCSHIHIFFFCSVYNFWP